MPLKSIFRTALLLFFLSLSTSCLAQVPSASPAPLATGVPLQRLQGEFARAAKFAGGTLGVSAVHLETGRRIAFNGQERFPMASTYKVPIAVQLLHQVDQEAVSLDRMVELKTSDFHPGSGMLTELLSKSGVSLSVRNLLELMLVLSDNTAADLLLRLAGGPEAVTARVRAMGIQDMDIHRPTVNLIADSEGYALPPENEWKPDLFQKLYEATTEESRKAALRNFQTDPRDTSSPEAMAMLLERMVRGEGLKSESRALLLDIMERCQTGKARIKGILPPGTVVVHKTGTFSGITNDAGIINLPQDAGHVAIAVFVKSSERTPAERERAIAQVSRAVYDFFLFQPADRGMMK
jgi:beta-lactamase class A